MNGFFISFCTGCILIGALQMLCPEGNISKSVKYIFSLIFILITISAANIPIKNIDFSLPDIDYSDFDVTDMQKVSAEYVYSYTLKSQNINFSKISVFTDNSEDDGIVITKVIIMSNESHEKIFEALGILAENREVEIVNE